MPSGRVAKGGCGGRGGVGGTGSTTIVGPLASTAIVLMLAAAAAAAAGGTTMAGCYRCPFAIHSVYCWPAVVSGL